MWTRPLNPLDRLAFVSGVLLMAIFAIHALVPDAGLIVAAILN
jgi:hypothetical protein